MATVLPSEPLRQPWLPRRPSRRLSPRIALVLDLSGVSARPGDVLHLVVTGAPGAHAVVVQGSQPGSEYYVQPRNDGTTLIRLKVPARGQVGVLCTTPGHENLHGNITIGVTE